MQAENKLKHIGLIMDGNRRWAVENGLSRLSGHVEGEKRMEPIVNRALELKISYLTFWAFAYKNWRRSEEEIKVLLNLFRKNLNKRVDELNRKNARIKVIGNLAMFPDDIQEMTKKWVEETKKNTAITVVIALSYGGRDEILRAIRKCRANSKLKTQNSKQKLTEKGFEKHLDTAGMPDPELIIRTGGQSRLSGFMPWQTVYSELYFSRVLWPDFTVEEFEKAVEWFKEQKRNFGK